MTETIQFEMRSSSLVLLQLIVSLSILESTLGAFHRSSPPVQNRSVEKCDKLFKKSLDQDEREACRHYCSKTYTSVNSRARIANQGLSEYRLVLDQRLQANICCCKFNLPWPDYVKPEAVGRDNKYLDWLKSYKHRTDCLPLVASINLSKRTKDSYSQICDLLSKKRPLNVLEMLKFVELSVYLKMMKPKHPAILKTLQLQDIQLVNREMYEKLLAIAQEFLFDSDKLLVEFGGYNFASKRNEEFLWLRKRDLADAIKSDLIGRCFDNYIVFYLLIDIRAANLRYKELQKKKFDCNFVRSTRASVGNYLKSVEALLSSLKEKLIFDYMSEHYDPLKQLIQFASAQEDERCLSQSASD